MSKNASKPYVIRVFPNTGHQFFKIPLRDLLRDSDNDFLERFVISNRGPWRRWSRYLPWILYRYEKEQDQALLRLAIETNLGMPDRGLLFDVDDELVSELPDEDEILNAYASSEEAHIFSDYKHGLMPLPRLPNKEGRTVEVDLKIQWAEMTGRTPVDVDLVVDLGNTRSVALLLENPGEARAGDDFEKRVHLLRFLPRGAPYARWNAPPEGGTSTGDDCAVIDSWMLLHRTQFHHLEPPQSRDKLATHHIPEDDDAAEAVKYRACHFLPHNFVEISPALIGGGRVSPEGAAKILAGVEIKGDVHFFLSSPKRYAWDDSPRGIRQDTHWMQVPNRTDDIPPNFFVKFEGLIRYFMEPSGVDRDIDDPPDPSDFRGLPTPKAAPTYPRRDAICWFALSILELAQRQINSPEYLEFAGRSGLPRRLHTVRVTYPAGWTNEEKTRYLDQWQRAVNLFTMTRFEDHRPVTRGGRRPVLAEESIDEAVCSQLPLLYSDLKHLGGDASEWFRLYGSSSGVTVMNLDIGGGTSDIAVIRYEPCHESTAESAAERSFRNRRTVFRTELKFRDGYTIAGDMLVKRLIERALLPAWLQASDHGQYDLVPEARRWIKRLLHEPAHDHCRQVDAHAPAKIMRAIRLVFIPVVNYWLQKYSSLDANPDALWEPVSLAELLRPDRGLVEKSALNDLNSLVDKLVRAKAPDGRLWEGGAFADEGGDNRSLFCEKELIDECIDEVFRDLFDSVGDLAAEFDCQLVIVSGKPSELPRIRSLLARSLPLLPQRIVHARNFPAGDWYPSFFRSVEEGRILDAKSCTVVGAALYQDMANGNIPDLAFQRERHAGVSRRCYWGIVSPNAHPSEFHKDYLFSPADYPHEEDAEELECLGEPVILPLNCRIGRQITKMENLRAEPVYQLRWMPESGKPGSDVFARVTLRWRSRRGEGERLELAAVEPLPDYPEVRPEDVSLRLNTMFDESHWLDDPHFDVSSIFTKRAHVEAHPS